MKSNLLLIACAALLALTACDKQPAKVETPTQTTETAAPQPQTPSSQEPAGDRIAALNFDGPTVVDFYATWCGPCKMVAPILSELEASYGGRVRFVRVDVDKNPELAGQYQVEAIPTLLFANKSGVVERTVGALGKEEIEGNIKKIL